MSNTHLVVLSLKSLNSTSYYNYYEGLKDVNICWAHKSNLKKFPVFHTVRGDVSSITGNLKANVNDKMLSHLKLHVGNSQIL